MGVKLSWRRAARRQTYHATRGQLAYTVDYNGYRWVVRGWNGKDVCLYDEGPTARSMKEAASLHATENS